ncbi:hypothetical protein TeGR_g14594 [Tetraparma gracilis]|uniref:Uncharacterized protein n=1 Tax=Tetraparma gracilis TaxID=2962635 RepID=A0ABQ6N425_9STRA|nr:hypothetical protein TeGR_g14594 [Tetraparma gracilis]
MASASQQASEAFSRIQASTCENPNQWPSFSTLKSEVGDADYNQILECPFDFQPVSKHKTLCPHGACALATIEWFDENPPYTGLFGSSSTCLVRLSTAIEPPARSMTSMLAKAALYFAGEKLRRAELFPCVAIKAFRGGGRHSGNLLFGGAKTGQVERNFFEHALCTNMTERVPLVARPVVNKFREFSEHPLSLGVSDFAAYDAEGQEVGGEANFPWTVVLSPPAELRRAEGGGFEGFLRQLECLPVGTHLYDLFTCASPAAACEGKLQRSGRVITTSPFARSGPGDGLFFKRKEEDYALRPGWADELGRECVLPGGVRGPVGALGGWELFEGAIGRGEYEDRDLTI